MQSTHPHIVAPANIFLDNASDPFQDSCITTYVPKDDCDNIAHLCIHKNSTFINPHYLLQPHLIKDNC